MINPPVSAPLPWRRVYTLGMTSLVDANGEPVISTDKGGLIVVPDVWEFLLAAVNARAVVTSSRVADAGDGSDYEFANHGQSGRKD